MNKLIHFTSNYPLKNQNVYIEYDIIQVIERCEENKFSNGTLVPEMTRIRTKNHGSFLVDELPFEVYQLIQDKIANIDNMLVKALRPFADLVETDFVDKDDENMEVAQRVSVKMVKDAKAALSDL